jgi:hypothetical protein
VSLKVEVIFGVATFKKILFSKPYVSIIRYIKLAKNWNQKGPEKTDEAARLLMLTGG